MVAAGSGAKGMIAAAKNIAAGSMASTGAAPAVTVSAAAAGCLSREICAS